MSLFRSNGQLEQKLAQNNDPLKQKKLWLCVLQMILTLIRTGKICKRK